MFYEAKGIKNPDFGPNKGTIGYQEPEVIGERFFNWGKCVNLGEGWPGGPPRISYGNIW